MGDHVEEGLPIALLIEKDDRLAMQVEPSPRQKLDHLFQGANAAGQNDKGVGLLEHDHLALMHRGHDHGLNLVIDDFAAAQEVGHDP